MFHSDWSLPADPDRVYEILADVSTYPRWWPQVRSGRRLDEASGELRCRSLLPYDLVFRIHREIEDPAARILAARLEGDLIGESRWTISADGTGTRARFDEDVVVGKAAVRAAGRLVRPALRLNHDLMMRAGAAGLRRYLTGAAPRS